MKTEVKVQGSYLRLHTGIVKLSEQQAKTRIHNMKALGEDRYQIVNQVDFKVGEEFEYEGNGLPKTYMGDSANSEPTPVGPTDGAESSTEDLETEATLSDLVDEDLASIARKIGIEDYEAMEKAELVEAIESAPDYEWDDADPQLEDMTAADLKEMAKGMEIHGYGSMNKVALVEAIKAKQKELAAAATE